MNHTDDDIIQLARAPDGLGEYDRQQRGINAAQIMRLVMADHLIVRRGRYYAARERTPAQQGSAPLGRAGQQSESQAMPKHGRQSRHRAQTRRLSGHGARVLFS